MTGIRKVAPTKGKPIQFYSETTVSIGRSQDAIRDMLKKFGALQINFSDQYAPFRAVGVQWSMPAEDGGEPIYFEQWWRVVLPEKKKHSRRSKPDADVLDRQTKVSMRALYYALKAKLYAIQEGLRTFEFEFLSDYMIQDKRGNRLSMGTFFANQMPMLEAPKSRDE